MKFLCDRCKTRYSIGDDRVRGKILKIRCKNCANVITVREGMSDAGESERAARPTTMAPPASHTASAHGALAATGPGALGAAFAQQLTKPPPALEEEWYVSIDGDQAGPFSLGEAQRWVSGKPFDADVHCWSEGFDDWLPVDKVSHFRGLRPRPQPPSTPPPPRPIKPPHETTPKPLFAATMAALERDSEKVRIPVAAQPAPVTAPRANGSAMQPALPAAKPATPAMPTMKSGTGSLPSLGKSPSGGVATGKTPSMPSMPSGKTATTPRTGTAHGVGGNGASPGAKALAEAFDLGARPGRMEVPTGSEFSDDGDMPTVAEPLSSRRIADLADGVAMPKGTPVAPMATMPDSFDARDARPPRDAFSDAEDNLDIGEVSRVVKLADIVKAGRSTGAQKRLGRTSSHPKLQMTNDAAAPFGAAVMGDASAAPLAPMPVSESAVAQAPAHVQRRGMILLLTAAGVLLAGVVVAVVLLVANNGDDDMPTTLGRQREFDTSRPEEAPRPRNPIEAVASTGAMGSAVTPPRPRRPIQQIQRQPDPPPEIPNDPTKSKLKADEIEDMATKQGEGTKRCYMRAQKGALGLDVGDIKKIDVLLTVDKDGAVTDVSLSDHAADNFGKCLISRIRGWKFRASPGGTYKFALAFSSG